MASHDRPAEESLISGLEEKPYAFDFFQVARRFECSRPDLPRIGSSQKPEQDPIRFGQEPSLAFAPAALHALKHPSASGVPKLLVNFLGLLGPNGAMPLHITQYVRDRLHNEHDPTLATFLDIFHHRILSLFYRAWANCQPTVNRDRPDDDRLSGYISSLIGLGMEKLADRDSIPEDAKRYFAGRLALQTRNAEGLTSILSDFFGVQVDIEEFVGHWVELSPEYQCRLGESPATGRLGQSTIMGGKYWDCQQKFSLRIGPLDLDEYQRFLPNARSFSRIRDWIRNYAGTNLKWELKLVLKPQEVPRLQLGASGDVLKRRSIHSARSLYVDEALTKPATGSLNLTKAGNNIYIDDGTGRSRLAIEGGVGTIVTVNGVKKGNQDLGLHSFAFSDSPVAGVDVTGTTIIDYVNFLNHAFKLEGLPIGPEIPSGAVAFDDATGLLTINSPQGMHERITLETANFITRNEGRGISQPFVFTRTQDATGSIGHLGWTTWLTTHAFTREAEDLILQPPSP